MSNLFDNAALQKYLHAQIKNMSSQKSDILTRWQSLLSTTSKNEEQLQTDFLNDIFGDVLGYTYKRGEAETNLEKEEKTELDGQKPDGILGFFNDKSKDVRVVIELKDQKTDLDKKQNRATDKRSPVEQAFGYVSKYQGVEWVIVSNFKEIRLYKAGYAGKYHAFTMEELANNPEKQHEFHFLLAKDRLFCRERSKSPVHSLDTTEKGEEIEKRFYKHYSTLRAEIWHNLLELNKEKHYGRNFYLYKAQKLIDRMVFVRFCRENGALDNDAVLEALNNKYIKGKYNRMKALFMAMDEDNPEIGIAKFNGGLFATDKDLDCLNISDEIIDKIVILYAHDFGSDLDVNILGHIFEQSISDLENLTGDNEKKRKKDGVFYTPAYITEYILKEAVGSWLADRKAEIKAKENSKDWWKEYAQKLKSIKVLDPACGSGAFLVKVFDYLQNEWREVEKHIKTEWTYKDILTHNIYGVDINPASVGITKLSLWLKTAHHREPLTTLDDNIKIGNSLIDNPDIAGYYSEFEGKVISEVIEKDLLNQEEIAQIEREGLKKSLAFNWNEEFKQVFESGGFDVVVGNPPYVLVQNLADNMFQYFCNTYKVAQYKIDLYQIFIEKGLKLLNRDGYISYITPNTFLKNKHAVNLRHIILQKSLTSLRLYNFSVFEGVSVDTLVFAIKNTDNVNNVCRVDFSNNILDFISKNYRQSEWVDIVSFSQNEVIAKIESKSIPLKESNIKVYFGIQTHNRTKYVANYPKDSNWFEVIDGANINRYNLGKPYEYVNFSANAIKSGGQKNIYLQDRICVRQIGGHPIGTIVKSGIFTLNTIFNIYNFENVEIHYILSILNSKVIKYYWSLKFYDNKQSFPKIKKDFLLSLPIPQIPITEQTPFITHAQKMLDFTKQFNDLSNKFIKLLGADLGVAKITKKLEKWYNLQADEFFAEVGKQNKNLSLSQKSQWLEHFDTEKQKALAMQNQITKTDAEIDKMVYALYGLSEDEIRVVENLAE